MKLTSQVKLKLNDVQKLAFESLMKEFNQACNLISEYAFEFKIFRQYDLHEMLYYMIRDSFDLSAQMVIRALSKVADSYKKDQKTKRIFRPCGAVCYDARVLTWKEESVSIWTQSGRITVPFCCGEHQQKQLEFQKGETDLIYKKGEYFLYTTCDIAEKEVEVREKFLGVDVGVINIAADNLKKLYRGSKTNSIRFRNLKFRAKLQSKGTKSAKKKLKKRSKKEKYFVRDTNHKIAKEIVERARRQSLSIAMEDLKGIRKRVTVRKAQRYQLHSWAFNDLQKKIKYKAEREGIEVRLVDPRYTSQQCSRCGHIEKGNRVSQSKFSCKSCGYSAHADINAACVIASRAVVNRPNVVRACS